MSSARQSKYSVPQGTVLDLILFNIYINDLLIYLDWSNMCKFADDTMLYVSGNNIEDVVGVMNEELLLLYYSNGSVDIN